MVHLIRFAHVTGDGTDLGAQAFDLLAGAGQLPLVARAQHQVAAVMGELFREGQPQSTRAAGDQHRLSAHVFGRVEAEERLEA